LLLVVAAYAGLWNCDFVNFDDRSHIYKNPVVKDGLGWAQVHDAFTTFPGHLWAPLTWISLSLDVTFFGLNPVALHCVNLALHLAATALLFRAVLRLTEDATAALLVAALFGVHPLNVESVAWITERKNVLSGMFWLLALGCYAAYARDHRPRFYGLTLLWYACGLMAKPAVVTLPCVLLLLDCWPLKRFRTRPVTWLIAEKLPFLTLAVLASVMTMKAQAGGGAVVGTEYISVGSRVAYAFENWAWYLGKLGWPQWLGPYYNHPVVADWPTAIACALVLVTITVVCVRKFKKHPQWLIGWAWYVGVLVPMIGLVQVGGVARADRFSYLPQIGIWLALAVTVSPLLRSSQARRVALGAGAVVLGFAAVTSQQVSYWENSIALFERALATTNDNYSALCNAADAHAVAGNFDRAAGYYQAAIRLNPDDADLWNNLGSTLLKWEKYPEALRHFGRALQLRPGEPAFHYNAALALTRMNLNADAECQLNETLALNPDLSSAHALLAQLTERRGDRKAAIDHLQRANQLRPNNPKLMEELARVLRDARGPLLDPSRSLQ
jgi:tetratricopeptide (TPR) repeat protein